MPKGVEHTPCAKKHNESALEVPTYKMPKGVEHKTTVELPNFSTLVPTYKMPKGVEHHVLILGQTASGKTVPTYKMPKGVEHHVQGRGQARCQAVPTYKMPKGVEHGERLGVHQRAQQMFRHIRCRKALSTTRLFRSQQKGREKKRPPL